jgi:hypothetical protein
MRTVCCETYLHVQDLRTNASCLQNFCCFAKLIDHVFHTRVCVRAGFMPPGKGVLTRDCASGLPAFSVSRHRLFGADCSRRPTVPYVGLKTSLSPEIQSVQMLFVAGSKALSFRGLYYNKPDGSLHVRGSFFGLRAQGIC